MTSRLARKKVRRHRLTLWLVTWLIGWTSATHAQQAQFVWERDPGAERCPSGREIAQAVNARLGYAWLVPGQQGGERAFGRVSKREAGYELLLTFRDADKRLLGTRRLHDPSGDCTTLVAASVLALTLMASAAPTPQPAPTPRPSRVVFGVEAGAAGSVGLLSAPRAHAFVRMDALLTRRFALEGAVLGLGTARTSVAASEARVRSIPVLGLLAACVVILHVTHLRWDACLGLMAGALHTRGEHFSGRGLSSWSAFVAPLARLPFRIPIAGPLQAGMALNLGVPLLRAEDRYVDPAGATHTVRENDPVFAWLELGLGAAF